MNKGTLIILFFLLFGAIMTSAADKKRSALIPKASETIYGVRLLTGTDHKPHQKRFAIPELADPFLTHMTDSVVISGTAPYYLSYGSIDDVRRGNPRDLVWNDFHYADGTPMEGNRLHAHSWDMKPVLWSASPGKLKLWDSKDPLPPQIVWYGGHMRPRTGARVSQWPADNFSRDVFAFTETEQGKWTSRRDSIFVRRGDWPRKFGDFKGHRYGHQIVPLDDGRPVVFYEEVTRTKPDGGPLLTSIFVDEMVTPFEASGKGRELLSPLNPRTGIPYPSTLREDGSALIEGPLYFRFQLEGELWEAIGFSAGSFYSRYSSSFAARKVSRDSFNPFLFDLNEDGSDLHDAGAAIGKLLNLAGGPGRPAVVIGRDATATPDADGLFPLLFHAYRRALLPDHDFSGFPVKYGLHEMFRSVFSAAISVKKRPNGSLRFEIVPSGSGVRSLRSPETVDRDRTF